MNISPEQFLNSLNEGKTEKELNLNENRYVDPLELEKLTSKRYGHTIQSATDHLLTDYSNGFTICKNCGSYYHLGGGFTKHLSKDCLHCAPDKHTTYFHKGNNEPNYKTSPRWMAQMFDDGMHYKKEGLQIEKYKQLLFAYPEL